MAQGDGHTLARHTARAAERHHRADEAWGLRPVYACGACVRAAHACVQRILRRVYARSVMRMRPAVHCSDVGARAQTQARGGVGERRRRREEA
jgi:hypothetical protein